MGGLVWLAGYGSIVVGLAPFQRSHFVYVLRVRVQES